MSTASRRLVAATVAACSLAGPAQALTTYSLASDGTSLIRFDTATPGTVTTVSPISGATTRLDGLDFRPSNGQLYGYSDVTDSVYTVDPHTGATTLAAALSIGTSSGFLGIDFNPVADRLRIVGTSDQSLRANVAGGATVADGVLAYAAGDPNFGVNPNVIDVGYTNSSLGGAASTALYGVDFGTDSLVLINPPNSGTLNTVGALGINIDALSGFDIYANGSTNTAFGAFRVGGVNGLYSINLATGAATSLGAIGDPSSLYGLALVPGVPEPSALAMWGVAGLFAFGLRRRLSASAQSAGSAPQPVCRRVP